MVIVFNRATEGQKVSAGHFQLQVSYTIQSGNLCGAATKSHMMECGEPEPGHVCVGWM